MKYDFSKIRNICLLADGGSWIKSGIPELKLDPIILNNPKRKDIITKKLKYIINNYTNIKSILALNIGSSMESHISHLIASFFSSRPKGFSTKRIRKIY